MRRSAVPIPPALLQRVELECGKWGGSRQLANRARISESAISRLRSGHAGPRVLLLVARAVNLELQIRMTIDLTEEEERLILKLRASPGKLQHLAALLELES